MWDNMYRTWENNINKTIHNNGKNIDIYYNSVSPCIYCSIDPITGESTRPSCTTCHGTGKQITISTCFTKGVINTFINNKGYIQFGQDKINIIPEGEARLTIWLPDILKNSHSITGANYLDSAKSIKIEENNYAVKNYQRIGIEDVKVCIVTLNRIK